MIVALEGKALGHNFTATPVSDRVWINLGIDIMKYAIMALSSAALLTGTAAAQDGERRCCHVTEGAWLDNTYTPADCRARGDDYAPQGDAEAAMCREGTTTETPPTTPNAPGSPGGGSGDGDGDGSGAGGGDGSGGGGAGVQRRDDDPVAETTSLADMRFDYETIGQASLPDLSAHFDQTIEQRDFCDGIVQGGGSEAGAMAGASAHCYTNLRSNAHLITQNASRMRNDRTLNEDERHEAVHIMQGAGDIRAHAEAQLDGASGN